MRVLAVAIALAAAGTARADEPAFREASALLGAGRVDDAARAFVAFADAEPASPLAGDALYEAGQLYELRLGDPARAEALYERLLADYPDTRAALAAERRLVALRADLGPDGDGAEALARFNDVLQRYPERAPEESIRLVERLLADAPDWPGAPRAVLWLARAHERGGDLGRAGQRYAEVARRWPDAPEAFDARRGAGDVALERGHLDEAERWFASMDPGGDPTRRRAREAAFERLRTERRRRALYVASFAAFALALAVLIASLRQAAGSWRDAAGALRRMPTEAVYLAPVAAAMLAFSFTGHQDIAPACAIMLAGGLLVSWLSGAGLAAARGRGRALVHAGASGLAIVAVVYVALHRTRLLDLILQTVRFGPER